MKLILGSKSPRRSELLKVSKIDFEIRAIETDESYPSNLALDAVAEHIAIHKAKAHEGHLAQDEYVLTADTIVVFDNKVYGKPTDAADACKTILALSNDIHHVYTAVCIMSNDKMESFTVKSEVKFGLITEEEAIRYVEEFNPLDKAGAYGIQDWIGFARVEWIKGSYTNILGLPMAQTYDALKSFVG